MKASAEVREYFSKLGKRGGAVKSEAKTVAARNAIKIRWEKAKKNTANT